ISKTPLERVRTLAADIGSRTSVVLSKILLAERYGADPAIVPMRADLDSMLANADACLIIGDPALRLDPAVLRQRYEVVDLGEEWVRWSGHPMVFALWAGRRVDEKLDDMFRASCRYGLDRIDEIVAAECPPRNIPLELGRDYLTNHIVSELKESDLAGMGLFLHHARELGSLKV